MFRVEGAPPKYINGGDPQMDTRLALINALEAYAAIRPHIPVVIDKPTNKIVPTSIEVGKLLNVHQTCASRLMLNGPLRLDIIQKCADTLGLHVLDFLELGRR